MRIAAGLVAGGVFPVAMALVGDLVPVNQRQVAIGRLLAVGLTGNLIGASHRRASSAILLGWRGVFAILGLFGSIVTIAAFFAFRGVVTPPPAPFNRAAVVANFRSIFADPRAKVCFISVFLEAIFIHGLFPVRRAAAARYRRDPRIDCGPPDRRLRGRRRPLFAVGAASSSPACGSAV